MNLNRLLLASFAFCGISAAAHANRNPTPPPSGIVVHLFGPNSVMSDVMPDLPGENARPAAPQASAAQPSGAPAIGAPAVGAPAAGVHAVGAPPGGVATAASASSAPQQADSDNPTLGSVLHQMFVVGDPNHPNQPSVGRIADHPPPAAD